MTKERLVSGPGPWPTRMTKESTTGTCCTNIILNIFIFYDCRLACSVWFVVVYDFKKETDVIRNAKRSQKERTPSRCI